MTHTCNHWLIKTDKQGASCASSLVLDKQTFIT